MKYFLGILIIIGLYTSCEDANPLDPTKPFTPAEPSSVQTLQAGPIPPDISAAMGTAVPVTGTVELPGKESLLQLRGAVYQWPSDYRIGSLAPFLGPDEKNAKEVLEKFLKSLLDKKPDETLILKPWKVVIRETLETQRSNWPVSYRIGSFVMESETEIRVTLGFTGAAGRSDGWVYLERDENSWKISDWQVDLLNIPAKDKTQVFDPEGFPMIRGLK
ncbi:MAG: hypothetical protein A2Z96_04220 [Spirochaetes bacterium GWB1_48_6]|nr:MAG: hypothetical protein A2Z96_04220 [Spirochaetes bacterium GWB1_48_6]